MRKLFPVSALLFLMSLLSSCEVIGGIFKAGMWTGILLIVVVVGVIIWILSKILGGGR